MAATAHKFGPGLLTVGSVGTPVDFSCQVIGAKLEWDKAKDDDVQTLCGDTVAGATTYSAKLTGSVFTDIGDAAGIFFYAQQHMGETVPFTFTPNTAAGSTATGDLVLDPLTFGGDDAKSNMTSDFDWSCVGIPDITAGP